MIKNVAIVPAVLANNKDDYRAQIEKINTYTKRIQVEVADKTFIPEGTLTLAIVWWPQGWEADLHLMTAQPSLYMDVISKLKPSLCILHAEAGEDLLPLFAHLKQQGIKTGVALLPQTYPGRAKPYIDAVDHVLVFAGRLGAQGGQADLMQMEKVPLIRGLKSEVEIGWDGGANMSNIRTIAHAGVDVINVGAALNQAPNPAELYTEMVAETDKSGVAL